MENVIMAVIRGGKYDLEKIIDRIRFYHASGDLTDDQCASLIQTARDRAAETMGVDSRTEILALWDAVRQLQRRVDALENGEEDNDEEEVPEDIPEYVQPTGAHDAYNTGDRVRFKDKVYECMMDHCVWNPEVYPAGWNEIEED